MIYGSIEARLGMIRLRYGERVKVNSDEKWESRSFLTRFMCPFVVDCRIKRGVLERFHPPITTRFRQGQIEAMWQLCRVILAL